MDHLRSIRIFSVKVARYLPIFYAYVSGRLFLSCVSTLNMMKILFALIFHLSASQEEKENSLFLRQGVPLIS
jgi:hypothetical protein